MRWIEVNGNDTGFQIPADKTRIPFKSQAQRRNWVTSKDKITDLMEFEKIALKPKLTADRWKSLNTILERLQAISKDRAGETKAPTGRTPLKFPGHTRLHREIQEIRAVRKQLFNLTAPLLEGEQSLLTSLRDAIQNLLTKSQLPSF